MHVDTTSDRVWGDDEFSEAQDLPCRSTSGSSKAKRPDLKPCVLSTRGVERAGPMGGKPAEGQAADKTRTTTLLAELAQRLARDGVQRGAYVDMAAAALVTEDHLAARAETLCITRVPATASAWGRVIAEAVAQSRGEEIGMRAQTPPTTPRPGPFDQVAERGVTLYGKAYRAVVVHSSRQDQRRQKHLRREFQASSAALQDPVREAAQQESCWRADAEAAATQMRALPSASHRVEVVVKEHPQ